MQRVILNKADVKLPSININSGRGYFKKVRKKGGKLLPIIFFEIYLTITVILFAFGPWDWGIDNPLILYPYLLGSQIALYLGYITGLKHNKPKRIRCVPLNLIKASILFNYIIFIPLIYVRSGGNYMYAIKGFFDPGLVYDLSRDAVLPYNITEYVNIVISPLTWSLTPWIIYYWELLSTKIRIAGLLGIFVGTVLPYVASGTNKGLFDILFVLIGIVLFQYLAKIKSRKAFFNFKSLKFASIIIVIFIMLAYYFGQNIEQRLGTRDFVEATALNARAENANVSDEFMKSDLSPSVKGTVIALTSYITQGYYGCSLALKEDFVPTYGIGNSRFLSWLIGDLVFKKAVSNNTYPKRVSDKTNWDVNITWSSIYPWFASDFTFLGTYVIVFLIGYLLAKSWIGMFYYSDPWAIVIFSLLCIMLFYFCANNQIFQTGTTCVTFYVALCLWQIPIES